MCSSDRFDEKLISRLLILYPGNAMKSTHMSVAGFTLITLGYWINCRRDWARSYFNMKQSESTFPEEIESIVERKKKNDTMVKDS